jgi:hypothetical protein
MFCLVSLLSIRGWLSSALLVLPQGDRMYAAIKKHVLELELRRVLDRGVFMSRTALDSSADLDTHELP